MRDIKTIVDLLKKASDAYYNGTPIISDSEFDSLKDELEALNPDHPFLKQVGAPVKISVWPKKKHKHFMGSQSKVNTEQEYKNWRKGKGGFAPGLVQVSHKLDGSTIVLTYKRGELQHAVTRGDGEEGEDITQNVIQMSNVLKTLPLPFNGVLRGEMMLLDKPFADHFKPLGYKNPRNAANGCARDKKGSGLLHHIKVIYFDAIPDSTLESLTTEDVKRKLVESFNLEYVHSKLMPIDKAWEYFEKFDRDAVPYLIDGLVVKLNSIAEQNQLGVVDGRPKGQVAIKFASKTAQTMLNDITWQVGLSGRITPVAELEPVDLDGVTISRSTLNNVDYIKALGVEIGDTVVVARLNDVIPGIVKVAKKSNSGKGIKLPKTCPSCGEVLERDGAYIVCAYTQCAGAVFGDMMTWIKIHNMLGFGRNVIGGLIDQGITTPDKLYSATDSQLADASGSAKIATKLKAVIDKTRTISLDKFLAGLNIQHLGKTNSMRIAKKFKTLDAVLAMNIGDLEDVQGIKTTAMTIRKGLESRRDLIGKLRAALTIKGMDDTGPLKGASFAMTGLRNWDGQDLAELIQNNGGEVKGGVSKELDYLIIKDVNSDSNKAQKAREYGTKLISPQEFMGMIQ